MEAGGSLPPVNRVLLDTNVLVYAEDTADVRRQPIARRLLEELGDDGIVVSAQVLSEFGHVLIRPRRFGRDPQVVHALVEEMMVAWEVLPLHGGIVLAALEAHHRWHMPYYDAQIWAAAALNAIPVVLSEDFRDGSTFGGVTFMNPFAEGFDVSAL